MSDDLAEFIRARLDEDEAAAKSATPGPWTARNLGRHDAGVVLGGAVTRTPLGLPTGAAHGGFEGVRGANDAAHAARHDPARVLREVEAGRWMLAEAERWMAAAPTFRDGMLKRIAAVYSDHPDYRAEWKP